MATKDIGPFRRGLTITLAGSLFTAFLGFCGWTFFQVRDFPQTYASQAKVKQLEFELSEHNTSLQSKMDSILEKVDAKLNDFSKQYKEDFRYLLETNKQDFKDFRKEVRCIIEDKTTLPGMR